MVTYRLAVAFGSFGREFWHREVILITENGCCLVHSKSKVSLLQHGHCPRHLSCLDPPSPPRAKRGAAAPDVVGELQATAKSGRKRREGGQRIQAQTVGWLEESYQ